MDQACAADVADICRENPARGFVGASDSRQPAPRLASCGQCGQTTASRNGSTMSRALTMLTPKQKQYLRGLAHALKPVVMIGDKGLTESVTDEARRALDHHELIKVKVAVGDRVERQATVAELCARTGAETVQTLGRMATLYLANPEQPRITLP